MSEEYMSQLKGIQNQFGPNTSFLNQLNSRLSIMPGMGQGGGGGNTPPFNPQSILSPTKRPAPKNPPLKDNPQN